MPPPPRPPRVLVAVAFFVNATFISTTVRADYPPRALDQHFTIDPVVDITVSVAGAGLSGLSELILSTGEILPQKPGSSDNLLRFDRIPLTQTIERNASPYSATRLRLRLGVPALDHGLRRDSPLGVRELRARAVRRAFPYGCHCGVVGRRRHRRLGSAPPSSRRRAP